ncbi:MAG: S8 family peptidase, partial [Gammaproteobacteria bacterium]|nr:S8 family peptidase [Gammaproteobacteria bacterium]
MTALALLFIGGVAMTAWAEDPKIVPAGVSLEGKRTLRWVPGELIVKYKAGQAKMTTAEVQTLGLNHVRDASGDTYVYGIPADTIRTLSEEASKKRTLDAVAAVAARPDVEFVQPNYIVQIVRTPDDPLYPIQWHYFDNGSGANQRPGGINLPQAWDNTLGSPSVVIAVIDTGILPNHPDITGSPNLAPGFDMISSAARANDGDGRDNDPTDTGDGTAAGECGPGSRPQADSWHGTHVSGTVGVGNTDNGTGVAGVNWASRVQPVRALGKCGGSTADINDAIRWAAGLPVPGVPNNANPARVINMSLGAVAPCSASPSTQSAINDATAAGTLVVAAAGNEAQDAANAFPASCDNVLTVAASDFNGNLVTRYSNFGAVVEIMAPGGDVQADRDNDGNPDGVLSMVQGGYAFFNGTSMASPHAAGVAGLMLADDPTLTPAAVTSLITSNAIPRSASQCPQPCGAGLLNADVGGPPPPPPA